MTTLARTGFFVGCLLLLALPLAGCFGSDPAPLPQGPQTVEGLVKGISLSVTRRGTHVLVQNGEELYFLESSTVNLGAFEGRIAQLTGTVEYNTDPKDVPVLVVTAAQGGFDASVRTWAIPSMGISVDTPREWKGKITGAGAQFTATGSVQPLFTLFLEGSGSLLTASSSDGEATGYSTFLLGAHRGVRLRNNETGSEKVQIDLGNDAIDPSQPILTFLFLAFGEQEMDGDAWRTLKEDVVRSVKITNASSSSSAAYSSRAPLPLSGSGAGMPCGGAAGILCPAGLYCEITDVASNVGQCRSF
ncbi:MAG: hypothetical protein PHW10_05620 [Candidatus Peribacteraceae bacterium]|nr:hypothetical protein [Candidatus Peribacteraceae bacterium]